MIQRPAVVGLLSLLSPLLLNSPLQAEITYKKAVHIITTDYDLLDTTYIDRGRIDGVKVGDKFNVTKHNGKAVTQVVVTGVFDRMASVKIVDSWLLKDGQVASFKSRPQNLAFSGQMRRPAPDITISANGPKAAAAAAPAAPGAPAAPLASPDAPPAPAAIPAAPGVPGAPGAADAGALLFSAGCSRGSWRGSLMPVLCPQLRVLLQLLIRVAFPQPLACPRLRVLLLMPAASLLLLVLLQRRTPCLRLPGFLQHLALLLTLAASLLHQACLRLLEPLT